jgi:hypothetical protein
MCPGTHFDVVVPCVGESLVRKEAEGGYGYNSRQSGPELNWGSYWGSFAYRLGRCWDVVSQPKVRSLPKSLKLFRLSQLRSSTPKLTTTRGRYLRSRRIKKLSKKVQLLYRLCHEAGIGKGYILETRGSSY